MRYRRQLINAMLAERSARRGARLASAFAAWRGNLAEATSSFLVLAAAKVGALRSATYLRVSAPKVRKQILADKATYVDGMLSQAARAHDCGDCKSVFGILKMLRGSDPGPCP